MRITQISIKNFGIYKDHCQFHFEYDEEKKVTLLRGENGSGKTTLLNSIKTVLYGPMLFGSQKQNNLRYINYIDQMLNTEARKVPSSNYSIAVSITANTIQFSGEFRIIRSWSLVKNKIKEELIMYNKGELMNDTETSDFFKAFYRFYPLELFELFYLDGEKIDQLSFFDSDIHKLIESTMNIDLFKTLKNDLEAYALKTHRTKKLDLLKKDKDYNITLLEHLEEKINNATDSLEKLKLEGESTDVLIEQLSKEIGEFNQNLPEIIQSKNNQLNNLKKTISKHMMETIPLLLLKTEIDDLKSKLAEESINFKGAIIRDSLDETLLAKIQKVNNTKISSENIEEVIALIKDQFSPSGHLVHKINFDEYRELLVFLSKLDSVTQPEIKDLFDEYHTLTKDIRLLNEGMTSYDSNKIDSLLEELLQLKTKSQIIINNSIKIQEQINLDTMQIESVKNKIDKLSSEIWKAIKSENINNVISKMNSVLDNYVSIMKKNKIELIENYAKDMFETLVRKKGFIKDIQILDKNIFLTTGEGNKVLVNSLSSGEKQLFVLSIIYALVKVSERSTPLIFDTLLGRLDKNHQQEVMEKFIASCPDQVIILATDSELQNIKPTTLEALVKTKYSIDLSKQNNRIEVVI